MKKLLFSLVLLFTLNSFGQFINAPVERAVLLKSDDHIGNANAAVVPDGKIWQLVASGTTGTAGLGTDVWFIEDDNGTTVGGSFGHTVLSEGWMIYYEEGQPTTYNRLLNFIEYNIDNQGLSYNSPNIENQIRLFPNPTTSGIALNSDNQYEIEVYDILGNKVMELTGNTIDMGHLSSATYIVNALDTKTNERLSYKVIKN